MAGARAHMKRLNPKGKRLVNMRAEALNHKINEFSENYGEVGVDALMEAVIYQYADMQDLKETSVSEIANVVEEVLLEKWGKAGAYAGAAAGAAYGAHVANYAGYKVTDVGDLGGLAVVIGGSTLLGAAVGLLAGKAGQWITKAVKKGMSREQATNTVKKAKVRMSKDSKFAMKARAAAAKKKKRR